MHPIEFVKCNNYFFISSHERYFWLKHFLLTTENILPVCFRAKPRFRYSKFKAEKPFILFTVFYVFLWFHTVFVLTYLIYLLMFQDLCLFCACLSNSGLISHSKSLFILLLLFVIVIWSKSKRNCAQFYTVLLQDKIFFNKLFCLSSNSKTFNN